MYGQIYMSKTDYALHQGLKECRLLILLLPSNLNHSIIILTDGLQNLSSFFSAFKLVRKITRDILLIKCLKTNRSADKICKLSLLKIA